jgi:hypothetical protein
MIRRNATLKKAADFREENKTGAAGERGTEEFTSTNVLS